MGKPILCLDFDGVIHRYSKGWQDGAIYDVVTTGFFDWALKAQEHFKLVIYSSRSKTPEGVCAMAEWLNQQMKIWRGANGSYSKALLFEFADSKPPAFLTIDDRAMWFNGDWASSTWEPNGLRDFKTWQFGRFAGQS